MLQTVVVGVGDKQSGLAAFRSAVGMLRSSHGTLHLVTGFRPQLTPPAGLPEELRFAVASNRGPEALLRRLAAEAEAAHVTVVTHPVTADPVQALTRVAAREHADLIVVGEGSQGHRHRRTRSVADRLTRRARCAVLIVPTP